MDISIIIPAYNRLWSLPQAIESCRNTKCATEIIVVDDGSTDGTWDWLQMQKNIVILKQPNWGKCWAVNKAFSIARGKYIRFLDSDDLLNQHANDEQLEIAKHDNADIVVSGYQLFNNINTSFKPQHWIVCDDFIAQQLGECDSSHYSAYLFKKDFINDIPHRPDFAFRDDRLLVLEAALKEPRISVHNGIALLHRIHPNDRLQSSKGLKMDVQNFQHLNLYKHILHSLQAENKLNNRRINASLNFLWPLCTWVAKTNINEAYNIYQWILELKPDFKIPEKGILGFLYKNIGVNNTCKILRLKRSFNA
ncbi:MAG: hypothetical protein JWQ57_4398 [Mucilaginibacter sp.]|nr:hypothetical protein [Mucilaginibacter sp.]